MFASGNVGIGTTNPLGKLIVASGNVGIGSTAPGVKLKVAGGQMAGTYYAGSSLTIDWNQGNIQSTSAMGGTLTFVTGSMEDGANYTLILANGGDSSFLFNSADITTWYCTPLCGGQTVITQGGMPAVLHIIKAGSVGYVQWANSYANSQVIDTTTLSSTGKTTLTTVGVTMQMIVPSRCNNNLTVKAWGAGGAEGRGHNRGRGACPTP